MKISIEVVAVNNLSYSRIGGKPFMGAQYVCVDGRDSPIWIPAEKPPLVVAMFVDLTCTDRAFRDGDGLKSGESDLLRRGIIPFPVRVGPICPQSRGVDGVRSHLILCHSVQDSLVPRCKTKT